MRRSRRSGGDDVVVVTDLQETLEARHRRLMRHRLVAMVVWIAGWIVAGALWRDGWLATGILLATGPGVWLVWWLLVPQPDAGRRRAVTRRGPPALPGRRSDDG